MRVPTHPNDMEMEAANPADNEEVIVLTHKEIMVILGGLDYIVQVVDEEPKFQKDKALAQGMIDFFKPFFSGPQKDSAGS